MKVAALIPCRDEEATVGQVVSMFLANRNEVDVYVIDNGSRDSTAEVAITSGARVLNCPSPGKARAMRTGIKHLLATGKKYDAIVMVDGDATYDLSNLDSALDLVVKQGFDTAIGVRKTSYKSKLTYRPGHVVGNRLLTTIFQMVFPIKISDSLSGFRIMSPQFLSSFVGFGQGFEIEAELNAHIYALDASVAEFDCAYGERNGASNSKLRTFKDGYQIFKMLFWLFRAERPQMAFFMLGAPFAFVGTYLNARAVIEFIRTQHVSHFPSLILGCSFVLISAVLNVAGIILQSQRLTRVQSTRREYLRGY